MEGLGIVCPANAPVPMSVSCAISPTFNAVGLPVIRIIAVEGVMFFNLIVNGKPVKVGPIFFFRS